MAGADGEERLFTKLTLPEISTRVASSRPLDPRRGLATRYAGIWWRPVDTPLGQVGPPIEIEISFLSRYMTFTSSLLARGSLLVSLSRRLSSRLSLVSDETGFAPVRLPPRTVTHVPAAVAAFSLCYVLLPSSSASGLRSRNL